MRKGMWLSCVIVSMVAVTSMVVLSGCSDADETYSTDYRTQNGSTYAADQGRDGATGSQQRDVIIVVEDAGRFSTLKQALQKADLDDTLRGEGQFTVFAPNDEAFDKLPPNVLDNLMKPENKDTLRQMLQYHVASGKIMSRDLKNMDQVDSLSGRTSRLQKRDDALMVGQARVLTADIQADNGIIHEIDTVLIPSNLQGQIQDLSKSTGSESQKRYDRDSEREIQQEQDRGSDFQSQQGRDQGSDLESDQATDRDTETQTPNDSDKGRDQDADTDTDVKIKVDD